MEKKEKEMQAAAESDLLEKVQEQTGLAFHVGF